MTQKEPVTVPPKVVIEVEIELRDGSSYENRTKFELQTEGTVESFNEICKLVVEQLAKNDPAVSTARLA